MRLLVSLTAALCLLVSVPLAADTNVSGTIGANTTWTAAASPYVVTGSIIVANGATLSVEPGVLVKFNTGNSLTVQGTLTAVGTSSNPITFTSSAASPTRGSWGSIDIDSGTNTASQISYATISYGGSTGHELRLLSGGPTLDHLTVTESSGYGVRSSTTNAVMMSSVTVSNCTSDGMYMQKYYVLIGLHTISSSSFTNNAGYGLNLDLNGHVSITNTSFTNNTNYAIAALPSAAIDGLASLTVSGNGSGTKDALQYRAGTITDRDEIWRASALPYVVTGSVAVGTGRVLTVEAGSMVKFASGIGLTVQGRLTAVGTSTNPITFTASAASPTRGSWGSVEIDSGTNTASQISYATISYGGSTGQELRLLSGGPTLDHLTITESSGYGIRSSTADAVTMTSVTVSNCTSHGVYMQRYYVAIGLHTVTDSTFTNNGGYGMYLDTNANATVHHCAISGNTAGGITSTANIIDAKFCYWGNATGPSSAGFGSGQAVNVNILFEPWLAATPTTAQRFISSTVKNRTFNPAIQTVARIFAQTNNTGSWTANIINATNTTVRTYGGAGPSPEIAWDGKDTGGVTQPNGNYTYELQSVNGTDTAAPLRGRTIIDTNKQLTLTGFAGTPSYFTPNADGITDTTSISGGSSFDDVAWTMTIKDSSGNTVRTATGSDVVSYTWDGRNTSNVMQPDAPYTAEVIVTDGSASVTKTATVTIDTVAPIGTVTAPVSGDTISNVYRDGATDLSVTGSITDANLKSWTLDYSNNNTPNTWMVISSGTSSVSSGQIVLWPTLPVTNGGYTLRLRAWDQADTLTTSAVALTIANFKVTQSAYRFNPGANGTITYTSTVPFTLTETLTIKNEAGALSRTLVNALQRTAGTYTDVWNGRNDATALIPDGAYVYTATVTDGSHTITWDTSNLMRGTTVQAVYPPMPSTFDPFTNKPVRVSYTLSDAYRVSVEVGPQALAYGSDCAALLRDFGTVCLTTWRYEADGTHNYSWWGTNQDGSFLPDKKGLNVILRQDNFPQNVTVAYGTAPTISSEQVTPALFNPGAASPAVNSPAAGTQTITFTLGTYQSQAVTVTVRVVNQSSVSTLRTIAVSSQAPGTVSITWDGRADNGMWVAPGIYTLIVTATDAIGNATAQHLVTTIEY